MRQTPKGFEISTSCKNCYFAEYQDNTQTGCKLGRLEKYRNLNVILQHLKSNYKKKQNQQLKVMKEKKM